MLLENPWLVLLLFIIILSGLLYKHFFKAYQHDSPAPNQTLIPNTSNELTLNNRTVPLSVNYHFTRRCNYACGFCFHTDTNSYIAPLEDAKEALLRLSQAGMKKVNFAGGEPFLYASMLGKMVDYCKQELKLESVSIVSNGSKITETWIKTHAENLDILAISCDSFDETTNIKISRGEGTHIMQLYRVAEWCREYGVMFKLNSVICKYNFDEDMNSHITRLQPYRWKCFQVLLIAGENDSDETKRDARSFQISDDEFELFCKRHVGQKCMVPENNKVMASSYLILDERLRFLDKSGESASGNILEVGVEQALNSVFWDMDGFKERGGVYAWNENLVQMGIETEDVEHSDTSKENEEQAKEKEKEKANEGAYDARRQITGGAGCAGGAGPGAGNSSGSSGDMEDIGKKAKKD